MAASIKSQLVETLAELKSKSIDDLLQQRYERLMALGIDEPHNSE